MSGLFECSLIAVGRRSGLVALVVVLSFAIAAPVGAIDLSPSSGKFQLSLDTTVSWGARWRVQDRDYSIISPFEGGTAWSVNGDDGNLNFDKGLVSNTAKATIDFALSTSVGDHDFGVFARGSAFYDFALMRGCCERTALTQQALDWAGNRVELLDAYAWWQFPVGNGRGELRVGRQVLNWGESTFIPGGISVTNPVDLSALRVPGAELREAYRPIGLIWGSVDLSSQLSLQGYYEYEWEETVIDPPGTYFSTNDFAGRGGERVFLAFASFPDTGESPFYIQPPVDYPFMSVPRTTTDEPSDGGQYGLSLRWFVPKLGGTEFGFYFINYHSRLPIISGVSGSLQGAMDAAAAGPAAAGVIYQIYGVPPGASPEVDAIAAQVGKAAATSAFANTGRWFTQYPEDIKLYGLSWNAQLGTSGIAFQGEVSYRQDVPFQVDDVELLFASLSPISPWLAATNQVAPGGVGFSEQINGYRLNDAMQFQFTLTKVWSRILGADQGVLLLEPAVSHVFDMPSKDELRYEGPGTYTSGNPLQTTDPNGAHIGKRWEDAEHFADPTSWGYRLAGRLLYNNVIGAWSLIPSFGWQQDVDGVSPGPGGNFIEGLTALTLGLATNYQNAWEVEVSYTNYSGASRYNLINDRDFVGAFVRYSF